MQLQVIWKRLYKCSSSKDVGTLYQLRNLINRRNVVSDPTRDVTACEEFFLLVVEAHILYAAMDTFGMTSIDDVPSNTDFFPEEATTLIQFKDEMYYCWVSRLYYQNLSTSPSQSLLQNQMRKTMFRSMR